MNNGASTLPLCPHTSDCLIWSSPALSWSAAHGIKTKKKKNNHLFALALRLDQRRVRSGLIWCFVCLLIINVNEINDVSECSGLCVLEYSRYLEEVCERIRADFETLLAAANSAL